MLLANLREELDVLVSAAELLLEVENAALVLIDLHEPRVDVFGGHV